MTYIFGLERILARFIRFFFLVSDAWFGFLIIIIIIFSIGCYTRMKLELLLLKLLNLMQSLVGVLCSTGNSKVMNLTNFCHTLNHVLYHWKVVLLQDLRPLRRKNLKHGYILVKENALSG